ncbi:MAG: hypothetical protein ACXVCP_18610 [Bdellovibrio sp.]
MKKILMTFIFASAMSPAFAAAQQTDENMPTENMSTNVQDQKDSATQSEFEKLFRPHCRFGYEIRWCWDWRRFRWFPCGYRCRGYRHYPHYPYSTPNQTDNQDNSQDNN